MLLHKTPVVLNGQAGIFDLHDIVPMVLIVAVVLLSLLLNLLVPLHWSTPAYTMLWPSLLCLAMGVFYLGRRRNRPLGESWLYTGLWVFYPIFVTRLTYFAVRAGFPLRDILFTAWDARLGFYWAPWVHFWQARPLLLAIQIFAYQSFFWQPLLTVPILALKGPSGRNSEFLTSVLVGMVMVIAIFTLLPTIGPADAAGINALQSAIIHALRAGHNGPFIYYGIISFPSFHTAMAILITAAHRSSRMIFMPVLFLNLVMLSATPYLGDHYFCDMLAGAVIAAAAFLATRHLHAKLGGASLARMTKWLWPDMTRAEGAIAASAASTASQRVT